MMELIKRDPIFCIIVGILIVAYLVEKWKYETVVRERDELTSRVRKERYVGESRKSIWPECTPLSGFGRKRR